MTIRGSATWAIAALLSVACPLTALAGTTGTMRGRVVQAGTGAPLAGATVTAVAPAQTASASTDASGNFSFISLAPDTYTVTAVKDGFDSQSQPGISIFVDQSNVVSFSLNPVLKTIAQTRSRSVATLVHSGVTSDVYSINPAGQRAAAALGGAGSMNQAYSAIASAPGVNIPTGQEGWYQGVYIRGGDIDQVAYEFDGLPTTRQSDLAPIATLTSLGNQEVQVYTGGTPASSNSSGLAGYINQVIKTGTHPGYASGTLGIGSPAFYHSATGEASGATPDRLFSYYIGISGAGQDYRYADQFNGAGNPLYFYPLAIPSVNNEFNILDGSGSGPNYGSLFSPGQSYAQATNFDRENIINLHFGIPHRRDALKDDIQMLYVTGGISTKFFSSQNEIGLNAGNVSATGFTSLPLPFLDGQYYNGALMQAPDASQIAPGLFPSSPTQRDPFTGFIQPNQRDASSNDYSIAKLQYQKNFNDHSYARLIGYTEWSDWFINGPTSAQLTFGAQLADYEVLAHIYGGDLLYSNQLSAKNLISAQGTFTTQKAQTYNATFSSTDGSTTSLGATGLGTILSNYVGNNGLCYNWSTGTQWSCFDGNGSGATANTPACTVASFGSPISGGGCFLGSQGGLQPNGNINLTPGTAPVGSPAARAGAHWTMTENGVSAQVDNVRPLFSSYSLTDLWQPNDKLTVNLGVRYDHFAYATDDLQSGYPARAFWFNAYNNEFCGTLGQRPQWRWTGTNLGSCSAGLQPLSNPGNGLYNVPAGLNVSNVFQPRIAATWTLNPDTVVRGSYGKYARAEASSYYQYNVFQQNLPSFLSQFYAYGYHSPNHNVFPDTSNNFDLSLEKHMKGTAISYKVSPFYRQTRNQIQYLAIDALGGTLAGLNIGTQRSYGLEISVQDGDFSKNGLSALFSYTYTNSKVRYSPINGQSVIDSLNTQIALYNSYTSACAGVSPSSRNWKACGSGSNAGNAAAAVSNGTIPIPNPYYKSALQPLLDTGAEYSPYDAIPTPFNAANGFEVPNVATLILNYRRDRFAITPSIRWDDGSYYGSPLVWPGYVPQSCAALPSATPSTPGVSCPGSATQGAVFLPDPYTGRFDSIGSLRDPSELGLNLQASYDVTPKISVTMSAVNLYHRCFQRGYAWDNSQTCSYSNLPSNILAPAGNFLTHPPIQVAYPYGTFFDITEVGASSVVQPFNFFVNVNVKL